MCFSSNLGRRKSHFIIGINVTAIFKMSATNKKSLLQINEERPSQKTDLSICL